MKIILPGVFLLFLISIVSAQPYFPARDKVYNDSIIPRIDIFMDADSFDIMYSDLYTETEYTATFIFTDASGSDTMENIGIRIRGNTSQQSAKKSFKISFNTFEKGRKFYGFEKLNLNGEHNDPSIIRSKLYWDLMETRQVPGPRANHADLYINGNFYGLYINTEHIDEQFIKSRFGNNDGNLYKCLWPADLVYVSSNPDDYKFEIADRRTYELQTNTEEDDYSDLADFISMLKFTSDNDFPVELEKRFNINSFLRIYALDVAAGHWDNYAYNKNNYYLYHNPETGLFEFISYDTDNTFGIDWVGKDWGLRDIYSWNNPDFDLPLIERIMEVPEYVSRFTFFMEELQQEIFNETALFPHIDSILEMIKPSAQADDFRTYDYGWSYNDFIDSYTQELGGQVDYGLKPYITTRYNETEDQLQNTNVTPIISHVLHLPKAIHPNDSIFVTAWVQDETSPSSVSVFYKINSGSFTSIAMKDDGLHYDGTDGDEVFGADIPAANLNDTIYYYVEASDLISQTGREPREGEYSVVVTAVPQLYINEVMASNTSAVSDEFGEFDDWVEIYNAGPSQARLGNIYLSDEPDNADKWRLPDVTIPPYGFIMIWCDEQTFQGDFHASFKLNADGERLFLHEGTGIDFNLLDSLSWTNLLTDQTIGYSPDGTPPVIPLEAPTPGYSNLSIGIFENSPAGTLKIFPNPFGSTFEIVQDQVEYSRLIIADASGKKLLERKIYSAHESFDMKNFPDGIFFLQLTGDHHVYLQKIVKKN